MRKLFRLVSAATPTLSLVVPLFLFFILQGLGYLFPSLFCMAVNPGGKEFICGPRYSHNGIRLLQHSGLSLWVVLLLTGGAQVFRGRAKRSAVIAWSVSALLLVSWVLVILSLPVDDPP